ncbi:MAG: chorismate mutase [Clostridia bacterium]|nr:chorismate mutase [Clostridia bacterium]
MEIIMQDIDVTRQKIEEIDKNIADLFEERMNLAKDIAEYKKERGLSVKDSTRENALLEKNRSYIHNPEIEEYYVNLQKTIMELSCDYQERLLSGLKVAYSGVLGAFAHIAAMKMFPNANFFAYSSFKDAYDAVENGDCDCCVLPLENSYAGEVDAVTDLLFTGNLFVNQVISLPIEHCLIAKKGASINDIKTVISHEQALKQCNKYISGKGFDTLEAGNTAMAAKTVTETSDKTVAAIASYEAADIYGLQVIERNINDSRNNSTRFAAFSRVQNKPSVKGLREDENFILVFTVQNKAGALAQTLNILGAHGYNMRSLRSRPMKNLEWQYFFYIEAEGNINNENGKALLKELSAICARLKLAGTYFIKRYEDVNL